MTPQAAAALTLVFLMMPTAPQAAQALGAPAKSAETYQASCAGCHGEVLQGSRFGPALAGAAFTGKWRGRTDELAGYIAKSMPPAQPTLSAEEAQSLAAYIDAAQTTTAAESGRAQGPGWTPSRNMDSRTADAFALREARLAALTPVTAANLTAPAAGDWPMWRRAYDSQGFSPLDDIQTRNVAGLQLAWSVNLTSGTNQIEPLVHDGVLFINSGRTVSAFAGETGEMLWEFTHSGRPGRVPVSQPRNIALWGSMLFVGTGDTHMIALDTRTGRQVWDHEISPATDKLQLTGGPIVVDGKVIQGVAGCSSRDTGRCFVVALDAATGRELWRFNTIARADEPGGDTWNGAPDGVRFGGSIWMAPSYDPQTNLLFVGAGQTYHITPLLQPRRPAGHGNSGLYTNATLALDPASGRLVWHYQHFTRDVWDLDWAFERTAFDTLDRGRPTRAVATIGKLGIIDILDARTGRYLRSHDLGLQRLVERIDPRTGVKRVRPELEPQPDAEQMVCPSLFGVRNFPATAFDPRSETVFVPILDACMTFSFTPSGRSDQQMRVLVPPESDGRFGGVIAFNLREGRESWRLRNRAPPSSGALATAGGLVFEGARDRDFRAIDSATGRVLWKARLNAPPNGYPISYRADGRQYVAVVAGGGGPTDAALRPLTPEIATPPTGTTLLVFALPPS